MRGGEKGSSRGGRGVGPGAPAGTARRRLTLAVAGLITVGALLLTPVGSELGLVGSARASTDIDPCGTANESTTPVNPALGFQVGSGPAALQCGSKETNFPLLAPEDVPVKAPDAGEVDPAFRPGSRT